MTPRRIAFWAIVAGAGSVPWVAPRPPMVDLPQHAGQVALALDLLGGQSAWRDLVAIDYLTPYLAGNALAVLLALVLPVATALKLLLSAAFYGLTVAFVRLRETLGGDPRLDWLFVPGFFGFAYAWGFVPYLLAAPFAVIFVLVAWRHADRPGPRQAGVVFLAGLVVFFSHGLMFLLAVVIGLARVAVNRRRARPVATWLPYLGLAGVAAASLWGSHITAGAPWAWEWRPERLVTFLVYPWGTGDQARFVPAGILMFAAPVLMGSGLQADRRARVPFAVLAALWLTVPNVAMNAGAVYERLGIFVLPFYALLFRKPLAAAERGVSTPAEPGAVHAGRRTRRLVGAAAEIALPVACCVFLASHVAAARNFAAECADFDTVLGAARPGQRALSLVFDPGSLAAGNGRAYLHFPLWYQAERGGLVDYNFAAVPPFAVRYRSAGTSAVGPGFEWSPYTFDWVRHRGVAYRYFFVRRQSPSEEPFRLPAGCQVALVRSAGEWSLYENRGCLDLREREPER